MFKWLGAGAGCSSSGCSERRQRSNPTSQRHLQRPRLVAPAKPPKPGQSFTKQPGDTADNSKSSSSRSLCHPLLPSSLSGPANSPPSDDTRRKIGLSWVAVTIPAADKGCLYRACGGWESLCKPGLKLGQALCDTPGRDRVSSAPKGSSWSSFRGVTLSDFGSAASFRKGCADRK